MASEGSFESDKGIGLAVVLGLLAVVSAVTTLVAAGTLVGALGFAGAMVLGCLLIVVLHVFD